MTAKHPAPFSDAILPRLQHAMDTYAFGATVLDPFAGVGRIHDLRGYSTVGVELEPEWAAAHPKTIVGDATHLPFPDKSFHVAATSPCYGNRLADHHDAKDDSHRRTYKHYLGRDLSNNSAGAMQWGDEYRQLHAKAWIEAHRVLHDYGILVLNMKDHQRTGLRQHVTDWHFRTIKSLGFYLVDAERIETPHFRFGANREVRYPERLLVFRKQP